MNQQGAYHGIGEIQGREATLEIMHNTTLGTQQQKTCEEV